MSEYKLTYFNAKGLGEGIRYILSYMGKEFEDIRLDFNDWSAQKESTPFGKLPMLEFVINKQHKKYAQSSAICRYLAVEAGLSGKTPLENLEIDQAAGSVGDLVVEVAKLWRLEGQAKEDYKKTVINELVPYYMERFEKLIQSNGGFLAVGRLTWADLYLVGYSETLFPLLEINDHAERYPHMKALTETVQSQPGIKEWIQRRPVTPF